MRPFLRLAAVLVLLLSAKSLRADIYQVVLIGSDQGSNGVRAYGLDDQGHAVYDITNCTGTAIACYITYSYGGAAEVNIPTSFAPPALAYDNGTACSPTVPGVGVFRTGVCNNGRYAFAGLVPGALFPQLFAGPDPLQVVQFPGADQRVDGINFLMNANGDFFVDNTVRDELFLAIDLGPGVPTPEPSSIALFGTGLLYIGAATRHRLTAPSHSR